MALLPEVATSSTEINIDDVQVGDPGAPLIEDEEMFRQLIWKTKHMLIGKGNALPMPHAVRYAISMSVGLNRLHSVYSRFWPSFGRNWQINLRDRCQQR